MLGKIKNRIRLRIRLLYLLVAVIALGIGGGVAFMGNTAGNPLLIALGFAVMACGVLLLKKWHGEQGTRILGEKPVEPPNCLVVSDDYVGFKYLEEDKLLGLSQKSFNDGKYYHVHRKENGAMTHFELPDDDENERSYEPTEMANVVTMPSNKKYFTFSASLMQTIRIGLMAIVVGAEIIGLVVLGGA